MIPKCCIDVFIGVCNKQAVAQEHPQCLGSGGGKCNGINSMMRTRNNGIHQALVGYWCTIN